MDTGIMLYNRLYHVMLMYCCSIDEERYRQCLHQDPQLAQEACYYPTTASTWYQTVTGLQLYEEYYHTGRVYHEDMLQYRL
jgi:hypothetical protein